MNTMLNLDALVDEARRCPQLGWRAMLEYVARLHQRSIRPAAAGFPHDWEEIGPGYCYGPVCGHWDLIHQILDTLPQSPRHARCQIENALFFQREDGGMPSAISKEGKPAFGGGATYPPVWPMAVERYLQVTADASILDLALPAIQKQIAWFEAGRRSPDGGFYYLDITTRHWESGVDEGVRFDGAVPGPKACVDATTHVYGLYHYAAEWMRRTRRDAGAYAEQAERLKAFVQTRLWDEEAGVYTDVWAVNNPQLRRLTYETIWPLVYGVAERRQAARVIDGSLLNPERFFTAHPIASVAVCEPAFALRMWRGPAWNSMTMWAALGCLRYDRKDAAAALLKAALDDSAAQFQRTGTIWEFYHPHGGHPEDVQRKPHTPFNRPCTDYLGHNPLMEMARLHACAAG